MINVNNPELLRYLRSELRPARMAVIMGGTLVGALLMALFISANTQPENVYSRSYWENVYGSIFTASSIILVLWSLLNATQAVVSERTHRTFDFWRTTRLSPITLAIGKLFGAPIGAWLQFATALPVAVVIGVLGGFRVTTIVGSFLVIGLFNMALSAVALCLSMRAQDQRRATMLMLVLLLFMLPNMSGGSVAMGGHRPSSFLSAWTALSPLNGLVEWHQGSTATISLFGHSTPLVPVTICLYLVIIAWCLAALARSIKLEPDQSSLFSPLQVIGISACLFLFDYAAFVPWGTFIVVNNGGDEHVVAHTNLEGLILTGVMTTLLCIYFTVNSTLFTRDVLRQELRIEPAQKIGFKLIAPWLATGAIAVLSAALGLIGYRGLYTGEPIPWINIVSVYLLIAAYAVRDGMFLQWMIAQRVKAPVLKGMALLFCYYAGSAVLSAAVVGPRHAPQMMRWLSPISGDPAEGPGGPAWLVILLLIPPIATAVLLGSGVFRKMQRVSQRIAAPVQV